MCRLQAITRVTVPGVAAVLFAHLEQSLGKVDWVLQALKTCQSASGIASPESSQEQGWPPTSMPCSAWHAWHCRP